MITSIDAFGKKLRKGGTGLFFYAGHGVQLGGNNYIIPVDAQITSESDVKWEGVAAGRVLGKMEDAENDLNIIIMDACRNNPFARSFRSSVQGLAKMDAPKGSLIAYSTAPGNVAADGQGRNGVYTRYLLREIQKPELKIEDVLKNVRIAVTRETGDRQVPWESSSLTGDFYFSPKAKKSSVVKISPSKEKSTKVPGSNFRKEATRQSDGTSRAEWRAWQEKMNLDFLMAQRYDSLVELSSTEKLKIWKTFLKDYPVNNPTSKQDEELREKALTRLAYWRADQASAIAKSLQQHSDTSKVRPKGPTFPTGHTAVEEDGSFAMYDNGIVIDHKTGLMWASQDNGENVDWY